MNVHDLIRVLPDIPALRARCRAMAALELLISGKVEYRYFSYDPAWGPEVEAALMNNGSGDEYAILFTPDGVFGRGFDHESWMSPYTNEDMELWPGLVDTLPEVFRPLLAEPAFCDDEVQVATVVFWRESADTAWRAGPVEIPADTDDGTGHLFRVLAAGTAEAYREFAEGYYERALDPAAVRHVWDLHPLTETVLKALNPNLTLARAASLVGRIGYPGGGTT
ncbi:hypothetical protein [Streptomyces sp. NPDC059761]|uniref:hypothetical protein n=1 Tax=Streptomyces sp. NPDC059761 TaxID=3346937 RepID=UPI003657AB5A